MSTSVYDIPVKTIQGTDTTLNQYQGKVLLLVNVASKCGLTPQYEGLQKLYEDKKAEGLEILGFPSNDFLEQEPGSEKEIQEFCSLIIRWISRCLPKFRSWVKLNILCMLL
jgi:Glutathione peroxidase